jgi:hypothetical protein
MGESMIRWLNLLGNRRQASIIMSDGSLSKSFDLGTGRAQGDNLSPNIFNFCEQILIFKLQLDNAIIPIPRPIDVRLHLDGQVYSAESNRETNKNESLADDNTVLSIIDRDSLLAIKKALEDFAIISGLHCNFDKTKIMPINDISVQEREWIEEAGFTVSNSITLLGAEITPHTVNLADNFEKIYDKILKLISFWSQFRLSLPGRITIAKTFLVSQINYLGCIFRPREEQLLKIQEAINNFVRKNLWIAEYRLYLPVEKGGIGFFNISSFLEAQRVMWLFKAKKKRIDNWRYDLTVLSPNYDVLQVRLRDVNEGRHPILYGIFEAYEKFYYNFCRSDNYKFAQLFDNPNFRDPQTNNQLTPEFFGRDFYRLNKLKIRKLTYSDCFSGAIFKSIREFREMELPLTITLWLRLRNTVLSFRIPNIRQPPVHIENVINRWRKGCRYIRLINLKIVTDNVNVRESTTFKTFTRLANSTPGENYNTNIWLSSWNTFSFNSDFRTFIFNTRYNSLPLNNRLNAYLQDVDPACTYCNFFNKPAPRDSLSHCFLFCPSVSERLYHILNLTGIGTNFDTEFLDLYWFGTNNTQGETSINIFANLLIFDSFRYLIFKHRLRRVLPTSRDFIIEFCFFIRMLCKTNKKIKSALHCSFRGMILLQALG